MTNHIKDSEIHIRPAAKARQQHYKVFVIWQTQKKYFQKSLM